MNRFYVYEHWRLDRDECFYVGKGTRGRAYSRSSRNVHWQNIVVKLERTGFAYEVRIVASNLSEEEAFFLEQERIRFWRDLVDLTNQTKGGEGTSGFTFYHSDQTKNKIGKSLVGRVFSEETRQKMSIAQKGKPLSKPHRERISCSLKGKPAHNKGKALPSNTREKMASSQKLAWVRRKCKLLNEEGND